MAYIDNACVKAIEFVKSIEPDIVIDNGINWIWAIGFSSKDKAEKFDSFCCNNGCETRGVYFKSDSDSYAVRFR